MIEKERELMNEEEIRRALIRIAHEILEKNKGTENLALAGVYTRGVYLAGRLADNIAKIENVDIPVAKVDVTLYRDDYKRNIRLIEKKSPMPTEINFDINDKKIVVVDDVLYTGRTVRAALDNIIDFGRPALVQLAVLVDRGHRELPIRADYVGKNIPSAKYEHIYVKLKEKDGIDKVTIQKLS